MQNDNRLSAKMQMQLAPCICVEEGIDSAISPLFELRFCKANGSGGLSCFWILFGLSWLQIEFIDFGKPKT
ncbi:hypothetical protein CEXT_247461 [Caerostris extrusa]|uniref:Uncharacterized protein n=1 Tax=Caerostris extrusa TaxID=172846 RepID=A0AAV4XXF7_CAEEX|nr:hypothetical protein CEXT_247461 [Caerostris extrusa]